MEKSITKSERGIKMSEVFIRSQKKNCLNRFGGNCTCISYDSIQGTTGGKKYRVCINNSGLHNDTLGIYKSEKRCIEILDEIQKVCGSYLYANGATGFLQGTVGFPPMAASIPRLYEMPEE